MSEPLLPHPSSEPDAPRPDAPEAAAVGDDDAGDADLRDGREQDAQPSLFPRPEPGEHLTADELQQELDAE